MNVEKNRLPGSRVKRVNRVIMFCAFVALASGCSYALHPYNMPSQHTLKVLAPLPQSFVVRVDDGSGEHRKDFVVSEDGLVRFEVPTLPRACAVRLFGVVKISDGRPEDFRAVHLMKGEKVVCKLSLNDMSKLPVDAQGVHVVKMK